MGPDALQKLTLLNQKQMGRMLPLYTKVYGIPSEVFFPIKNESIYSRDSQEIIYGANPDITCRILFTKLPGLRDPSDDIIDTLDFEEPQVAYGLNLDIIEDTRITTVFNGLAWQWRVKDSDAFYGADDKFIYAKYHLVGIA